MKTMSNPEQIKKEQSQRNKKRYQQWQRKYYHLTNNLPVKTAIYPTYS